MSYIVPYSHLNMDLVFPPRWYLAYGMTVLNKWSKTDPLHKFYSDLE